MLSAFANVLKVPELRARIIFTLDRHHRRAHRRADHDARRQRGGAARVVPHQVNNQQSGSVVALFNIFSGGALENCAIFSLGIMPYISASIMMQIMSTVIRSSRQDCRSEDGGRQKISQYTRYADRRCCASSRAICWRNPSRTRRAA